MLDNLSKYKITLASGSPRRKELLEGIGLNFNIKCLQSIDESYPESIPVVEVAEYIAKKKAAAYRSLISNNELAITADTVVLCGQKILGKPADEKAAIDMLNCLSGRTHKVITGVSITTKFRQKCFSVVTDVRFARLSDEEIKFYVTRYKPFDKAGAYGIQEWLGFVAVEAISGSYFNVMGLPIQRLYKELKEW